MKKMWLICNAHLDPVWLWRREEGAAEALSTFRVAVRFCRNYDGFVFNHNEALLYRWIEEYEPELFAEIQELVKCGKWHIMGGWELQPDCNMPSGESFVRQILSGRKYFAEKFGVRPETAINFDPFGHTRGLVQILSKSGYTGYLFTRPSKDFLTLPEEVFEWIGYDGSSVTARRMNEGYNSALGHATDRINRALELFDKNRENDCCLWGVGNHGGGPSEKDLNDIAALKEELKAKGIELIHGTPEDYFSALQTETVKPERYEGDLNLWSPGCYTSQIRIKQKHRLLENELYSTEKMCSIAAIEGLIEYPAAEINEAQRDLLFSEFHDILPGTTIRPAEQDSLRTLEHGLEILSRAKTGAFLALAKGQAPADDGEIPILVFNPHPYETEDVFTCEMNLWDQNWDSTFHNPTVYDVDGNILPTQCEKEDCNLTLDWRKRVTFRAKLKPMQMNRFSCRFELLADKPQLPQMSDGRYFYFENGSMSAAIDKSTGLLSSYKMDGKEYIKKNACRLSVFADNADPWGMTVTSFSDKVGNFRLMKDREISEFTGTAELSPIHIIEDGAVRTVVEVLLSYKSSKAVLRYTFPKKGTRIGVTLRVIWQQPQHMLKMEIPVNIRTPKCIGQVAYGEEILPINGRENISQRYLTVCNGSSAISVLNDGIYGSSFNRGTLYLSLLRSTAYSAHPLPNRPLITDDRCLPYADMGEREYCFEIMAGKTADVRAETPRAAEVFSEGPTVLAMFPAGNRKRTEMPFEISNREITLSAFKAAEDKNGFIIRLFNNSPKMQKTQIKSAALKKEYSIGFDGYEIKTFRYTVDKLSPEELTEGYRLI